MDEQTIFECLCPCCDKHFIAFKGDLNQYELEVYSQSGYAVKLCTKCNQDTSDFKHHVKKGDIVYIKAGSERLNSVYHGGVADVEENGVWVVESPHKSTEFVSFADILEWAIE